MVVAGTTYMVIAMFLLGIGLILFSASAVSAAQLILIQGIVAFARKACARNRGAMKESTAVGIDGSWNHRHKGSAHIIDMMDTESGCSEMDDSVLHRGDSWAHRNGKPMFQHGVNDVRDGIVCSVPGIIESLDRK
jgi:hypothetical protein